MGVFAVSGFSPAWLALREPADTSARNRKVLSACAEAFVSRPRLAICDLGAGTGASVRAFADLLPANQRWTLVDHDADNLAAALLALTAWADEALTDEGWAQDGGVLLRHNGKRLDVRTRVHDFARNPACWPQGTDLITASALIDLVSAPWIESFTAALAAERLPLLATLTADGNIEGHPPHGLDEAVALSFRTHQTRDKGFGPSAGAEAGLLLERALAKAGYRLTAGESPWILDPETGTLLRATAQGIAGAVAETGMIETALLADWLRYQGRDAHQLIIGHRDVFAEWI